ncbi:MAG: alpha-L-glutamate ligase-like protein [Alcanivorax sediminis]|uniref:Alpha-L-glutamate ligase-like protein n=1 Tax=Alcanivorax sediminis TaxID=2663008 RepID=A0A6N7LRF6_9GAMM|nr:alpha-L-glutamate ligase-like protein [Alcanivorax sediminis]MQX52732.1 alpha-L-glutamate ligase-like protein [Alcanivorax sediminis]
MLWSKTRKALRARGVMGINQRNGDYILRYNKRSLYPLVDDKLKTKKMAIEAGIRVPELYGSIRTEQGISTLRKVVDTHRDFVIKPAQGAGGDGIMVIADRFEHYFRSASGRIITQDELEHHISGILSGIYSLGGHRDEALIEYRVRSTELFNRISYEGVPDIRIIVLKGYPVAAMLRLPTRQSQGKANLHQGAIGVGLDLSTGVTLGGTWHNQRIERHPDTANAVAGLTVPDWEDCLALAARCYDLTGLGYLGVDLVMDRDHGPMMLELNARPGLNIQIAMDDGLLRRCSIVEKRLEALKGEDRPAAERVEFSKQQFAVAGVVPVAAEQQP